MQPNRLMPTCRRSIRAAARAHRLAADRRAPRRTARSVRPLGLWPAMLLVAALALAPRADAAPVVETFVMTVAGQSNVNTYSPPEPVYRGLFSSVGGVSIPATAFSNPAALAGAGIAGSWREQSAVAGPLTDSMSLGVTFNSGANTYAGSAATRARFGEVGVEAKGALIGGSTIGTVVGSESYALYRDSMTFFSATVQNDPNNLNIGYARYRFTIDGALSAGGASSAGIEAMYQHGTHSIYTLMRGLADPRTGTFISGATIPSVTNASAYGYTSSIGPGIASLAGAGEFDSFWEEFDFASPVDVTFGLLAYSIPGSDGTATAAFASTARLTGIEIVDRFGRRITDFTITSGSGTAYDANGAHPVDVNPVPAPGTAMLALLGLVIGASSPGWRRRDPATCQALSPSAALRHDGRGREGATARCPPVRRKV